MGDNNDIVVFSWFEKTKDTVSGSKLFSWNLFISFIREFISYNNNYNLF